MPAFLLDEHLPDEIARIVRAREPACEIDSVVAFEGGRLRGLADDQLLRFCIAQKRVLVTCDVNTIPLILRGWGEAGDSHAGVVFLSPRLRPGDTSVIARGILDLRQRFADEDWTNRVVFLRP